MKTLIITGKEKNRLEHIDVVRWQDGEIHVLGRREENMAFHIIHDAQTGKILSEDSFIHRGSFPLFMCGCHTLACEGDRPPLLDPELALAIHDNRLKTEHYDDNVAKFMEANLMDLKESGNNRVRFE